MPTRYSRTLATLHWLLALMIIGALFGGKVLLANTPNSDPGKLFSLDPGTDDPARDRPLAQRSAAPCRYRE